MRVAGRMRVVGRCPAEQAAEQAAEQTRSEHIGAERALVVTAPPASEASCALVGLVITPALGVLTYLLTYLLTYVSVKDEKNGQGTTKRARCAFRAASRDVNTGTLLLVIR